MKMLGGSYGEGSLFYSSFSSKLHISPSKGWKTHEILIDDITAYEEAGVSSSSTLGKAGIGAAAGFLLAGPLAGLAGMVLGASSGSKNSFTFGLVFKNGDSILINASAKDYAELKAALNKISFSNSSFKGGNAESVTKRTKHYQKTRKASKSQVIEGRTHKKAPNSDASLAVEFRRLQEGVGNNTDENRFFSAVNYRVSDLNNIKWRHFDELISDEEVKECICMAVAGLLKEIDTGQNIAESCRRLAERYRERAKGAREQAGFFGRAKAEEEAIKHEADAEKEEKAAIKWEKSVEDDKQLIPIFTSVAKRFVNEQTLDDGLKRYKQKAYLSKSSAIQLIERLLPEGNTTDVPKATSVEKSEPEDPKALNAAPEERLKKLTALKKKGLITEEEYKEQRATIITQL
jgi:hypothetical protein